MKMKTLGVAILLAFGTFCVACGGDSPSSPSSPVTSTVPPIGSVIVIASQNVFDTLQCRHTSGAKYVSWDLLVTAVSVGATIEGVECRGADGAWWYRSGLNLELDHLVYSRHIDADNSKTIRLKKCTVPPGHIILHYELDNGIDGKASTVGE